MNEKKDKALKRLLAFVNSFNWETERGIPYIKFMTKESYGIRDSIIIDGELTLEELKHLVDIAEEFYGRNN